MTDSKPKVRLKFHVTAGRTGHRKLCKGAAKELPTPEGRIPRISKLMALAIRFERLIRDSVVKDQAELAELAFISRARVTQIMDLLNLAPEIQETILFLPPVRSGKEPVTERGLRSLTSVADWKHQNQSWIATKDTWQACLHRVGRRGQQG